MGFSVCTVKGSSCMCKRSDRDSITMIKWVLTTNTSVIVVETPAEPLKYASSKGDLGPPCRAYPTRTLQKPSPQLTTYGYIEESTTEIYSKR